MSESEPYLISEAVVRQRTEAATRHGGQSETQIRSVARAHKRRFLRQTGLRIGDLDGVALALIDNWSRAQGKVTILDDFYSENGLVSEGEVDPSLRVYFTGINSARMALGKLAEHLTSLDASRGETLEGYIDQTYGGNDG